MQLTESEIQFYTSLLVAFKKPITIAQYFKNMGQPGSSHLNAKIIKLCREGFMEWVDFEIHPVTSAKVRVYKSLADEYTLELHQKTKDYGSDWLNKMFGVNKIEPVNAKFIQEKQIKVANKKPSRVYVSGSTLFMAI
jgi:hypothetical protein